MFVLEPGEADGGERLGRPRPALRLADAPTQKRQSHVGADGHPGQQRTAVLLEDEGQAVRRLLDERAFEVRRPARRAEQPRKTFQERGLAASRGSDDAQELSRIDLERQVVDRPHGAIAGAERLRECADLEGVHGGHPHRSCAVARQPRCQRRMRRSNARKQRFTA